MLQKEERPILKLPLSKLDKFLELMSFSLFIVLWSLCIFELLSLPNIIPIHFNFSGKPDNYGSKYTLLTLPLVMSLVAILFTYLSKRPHIFNYPSKITNENAEKQYRTAVQMLRILKVGILFLGNIILYLVYVTVTQPKVNFGSWILPIIFCSVLLPTIIYVSKLSKIK